MSNKTLTKTRPDFPTKGCGIRGAKQERHNRKGRSESGRDKPACRATWLQRWACRSGRAARNVLYPSVMRSIDRTAGRIHHTPTQGVGRRGLVRPQTVFFENWLQLEAA